MQWSHVFVCAPYIVTFGYQRKIVYESETLFILAFVSKYNTQQPCCQRAFCSCSFKSIALTQWCRTAVQPLCLIKAFGFGQCIITFCQSLLTFLLIFPWLLQPKSNDSARTSFGIPIVGIPKPATSCAVEIFCCKMEFEVFQLGKWFC